MLGKKNKTKVDSLSGEELGKNKVYAAIVYDKVAEQSSSIVFIPNIRLADRLFKASVKDNFYDYDVYILGIFDTSSMDFEKFKEPQCLPLDRLKGELNGEKEGK